MRKVLCTESLMLDPFAPGNGPWPVNFREDVILGEVVTAVAKVGYTDTLVEAPARIVKHTTWCCDEDGWECSTVAVLLRDWEQFTVENVEVEPNEWREKR